MMALIKSHSNYVLRKRHQDVSDGTVWERDMTTIGGVNQFSQGQTPIYKSSNFIIYVRNDGGRINQFNTPKWLSSGDTDSWTLETVGAIASKEDDENDLKIVLKKDYYDLRDFAYYGSLTELFRASITDIVSRFPGELYVSRNNDNVYWTSVATEDGERIETSHLIGYEDLKEVSNPFGIDIHSQSKPSDGKMLKYFADGGHTNYEIIIDDESTDITSYTVDYESGGCKNIGEKLATVYINDVTIDAYLGDGKNVIYLSDDKREIHIRPKEDFLAEFYNNCDNFEKLLMDRKTTPKYTATFSIIKENEYGYYRELEDFTFPTAMGGYNIDASGEGFVNYTARMVDIGAFYDDRFTDNLYRSMTHEAIKNFDWTYTREFVEGDEDEYVAGGERVQKALRIVAREFDEIKSYIDAIKDINKVTYDERNNIPDYFLTDTVSNDGWNVKLVYPYEGTKGGFAQVSNSAITPYSEAYVNEDLRDGYFVTCHCSGTCQNEGDPINVCGYDNGYYNILKATGMTYYDCCRGANVSRIRPYTDERSYTYKEANNEFLRRLKISSPYIWRRKGTVDGIEMVLGLFGFRSERWCNKLQGCQIGQTVDYTITEYCTKVDTWLTDKWDPVHQMYRWDWINSTKTIVYDSRNTSNYTAYGASTVYSPYQGLPIAYTEDEENRTRELYPYFDKEAQLDGNPYFQMNGGWLSQKLSPTLSRELLQKSDATYIQFDTDDNVVSSDTRIYKETVRNIRRVDTLNDLFNIPYRELSDGAVVYVTYLNNRLLIIDGTAYAITKEYSPNGTREYVSFTKQGDFIQVGQNRFFDDYITVYNSEGTEVTYSIDGKDNGYTVKAYLLNGRDFICRTSEDEKSYGIDGYMVFNPNESGMTHYFILNDVDFKTYMATEGNSNNGWRRLKATDTDYLRINTITNNNKGNNPHNGNMVYDNGESYFHSFEQLFKYPLDNNLFDERCYEDYYYVRDNYIKEFGFSFGDSTDGYMTKDNKIHGICKAYYSSANHYPYGYAMKIVEKEQNETPISYGNDNERDTYLSMNNKYLRITFNLKNTSEGIDKWSQIKYIDDVIMNYVTQMIPSTTILEVEYDS